MGPTPEHESGRVRPRSAVLPQVTAYHFTYRNQTQRSDSLPLSGRSDKLGVTARRAAMCPGRAPGENWRLAATTPPGNLAQLSCFHRVRVLEPPNFFFVVRATRKAS